MTGKPMSFWTCEQCGAQFPEADEPPSACPVCEDERQYVNWKGQIWIARDELAKRLKLVWRDDLGVPGIGVEPNFAIGQRALLLREADGCVMWDCLPLVTREAVEYVRALGGLKAIAVSHPHYYGAVADWSEAFGGVPIYLHGDDRALLRDRIRPSCRGPATAIGSRMMFCWCGPADILPAAPSCTGVQAPKAAARY